MKIYALGVDIGGTTVKMGLFTTVGNLVDAWEIPTRTEQQGTYILDDIAKSIAEKLLEKQISNADVEGIGLGVPGPVDENGMVYHCVNLGWGVFNVEHRLSSISGLKVKAGNDANVAALGEMWKGGGKGRQNMVMITLGTGIGGGIIIGGKILAGVNGAAGEIGHIFVQDGESECCNCGKYGCLEQYASANGIIRVAKRYLAANPGVGSSLRNGQNYTAKDIFDAAKAGDNAALEIVAAVGELLGRQLAAIACVLNPEVFVIGGGMSKAGNILLESIQNHFKQYAFHSVRDTAFKTAELGNNAGIYGGVKMILQ